MAHSMRLPISFKRCLRISKRAGLKPAPTFRISFMAFFAFVTANTLVKQFSRQRGGRLARSVDLIFGLILALIVLLYGDDVLRG